MPDCSVVIVNHRSADHVAALLRALASEDVGEVVVVDNASGDGSVERLRAEHPEATVVAHPVNGGFAAGVNVGFAHTAGDWVVVLNPDTVPEPGTVRALVEQGQRQPDTAVVAPRILEADGAAQPGAYRRFPGLGLLWIDLCLPVGWVLMRVPALDRYRVPEAELRDGLRVAHVVGAALAIRRAAYEATGGLDEGFFLYLEETEWQQRLARAGWAVEVLPSVSVVHLVRGGGAESLAPSPFFLRSMRHYLALRGVRPRLVSLAIGSALLASRAAARAEDLLLPAERRTGGARAAAYDRLWAAWRSA